MHPPCPARDRHAGPLAASLALLTALALVAGCGGGISPLEAQSTETRELSTTGVVQPLVVIETFNGQVTVKAGPPGRVQATVEVTGAGLTRAEAEADRANIATTLEEEVGRVRLRAVYAPNPASPGDRGASVTMTVPSGSELDIRTSNGAVTVEGVGAAVRVATSNGTVTVAGSSADTVIETSNGEVRLTAGTGMIDIRSSNAPVTVEATDAIVAVDSSSGEIRFEGSLAPGDSRLATANGDVAVTFPASTSFALDASTSNGRVTVGFPLTTSGAASEARVQGRVGDDPAVTITIRTSNADVTVEPAR